MRNVHSGTGIGRRARAHAGQLGSWVALAASLALLVAVSCQRDSGPPAEDRPHHDGLKPERFAEAAVDAFRGMDGGVVLDSDQVKGRNTWMLWSGGNGEFWDWLARYGFGTTDLLRMLDSHNRGKRFAMMGLINDPNMVPATHADSLGLWLDSLAVPERERGLDPVVYGYPSGIVGLRLYPNPEFDAKARAAWPGEAFYRNPKYYLDRNLVRPYWVGMACGFCHVAANPLHPPADPEHPAWEDLSANIGNQFFRTKNIFAYGSDTSSFVYQVLQAMRDGTLDTSFLGTDQIFNPSNMNSIFEVQARLAMSQLHEHEMGKANLDLQQMKPKMNVPHILKDGADNVGILGALSRVYVNIGTFHQQWLRNHDVLLGVRPQTPFPVSNAAANSVYWKVTEHRVQNLAKYFLRSTSTTAADTSSHRLAMRLEDAPGGAGYLKADSNTLNRGKVAFAENCARCHSSKRPPVGVDPRSDEAKAFFRQSVMAPDFRVGNFLSTDDRIPLDVIQTNACRAVGMNATRGHVWDNFSSETYKNSPASGPIWVYNPFTKDSAQWQPPGGGRGYYRVPTLVSIWSSAPFFHNNELGKDPRGVSVADRMDAFNDAVEKLLWPEKRRGVASIARTTNDSYLLIPTNYLPEGLRGVAHDSAYLRLGPIPKGTPIGLLASADLQLRGWGPSGWWHKRQVVRLLTKTKLDMWRLKYDKNADTAAVYRNLVDDLLSISNCPDFIEDKGHYFGTKLSDAEKKALIEFLKTL